MAFLSPKNYDATMALGRWRQLHAARLYIDEAVSEEVSHLIPALGKARLEVVLKALPSLLFKALQS